MKKSILNKVKTILFITMLVLSYFASDLVVNYIGTVDIIIIKRIVNIILVLILIYIYTFEKNK